MIKYKPLIDVRYIVVHCSATPPSMNIGLKEIDLWHRQRGFFMVGYHNIIRRNGAVEEGRAIDQPGAHVMKFNDRSIGICLVGGVSETDRKTPEANFAREQLWTLKNIVLPEWTERWPNAEILGHTDLDPRKACPSFNVRAWVAAGMPDTLP